MKKHRKTIIARAIFLSLSFGTILPNIALAQSLSEQLKQDPSANIVIKGNGEVKVGDVPVSAVPSTSKNNNTETAFGTGQPNAGMNNKSNIEKQGQEFSPDGKTSWMGPPPTSLPKTVSQQPVAPPTSLPPLPGHVPNSNTDVLPIPQTETIVEQTPTLEYSYTSFMDQLKAEGKRLQTGLNQINVVVVADDSEEYLKLVQKGLIKPMQYWSTSMGLKWYLLAGNTLNTNQPTTCFVVVEADEADNTFKNFIKPLEGLSHPQTGYAYLAAHEVGHCLDELVRQREINKKLQWSASDASYLGLLPQAVMQTYGASFGKDNYLIHPEKINSNPLQQQYNDQVADAFAVAWTMKLGGSKAFGRIMALKKQPSAPSIEMMLNQSREIERLNRADLLWDLAKLVQQQTPFQANVDLEKKPEKVEVARWIVSPQGLVPVDKNGNIISNDQIQKEHRSTSLQSLGPQGRSFDSLPRFGQ